MKDEKSWRDAVLAVLSDAKEPMHYVEIAEQIKERHLRSSMGVTPHISVNTVIRQNTDLIIPADERGCYILQKNYSKGGGLEKSKEIKLIKAFGEYWDRNLFESHGKIKGEQGDGEVVDFSQEIGIYLLYRGYECIYVGQVTKQALASRLKQHTKDRLMNKWDKFSWYGFYGIGKNGQLQIKNKKISLTTDDIADILEAVLIESIEPKFNNKRGNNLSENEYSQSK